MVARFLFMGWQGIWLWLVFFRGGAGGGDGCGDILRCNCRAGRWIKPNHLGRRLAIRRPKDDGRVLDSRALLGITDTFLLCWLQPISEPELCCSGGTGLGHANFPLVL